MKIINNDCQCDYCKKIFKRSENKNPITSCRKHEIYCERKDAFIKKFGNKDNLDKLLTQYGSILGLSKYLKSINFEISDAQLRKIYKDFKIDTSIKRSCNSDIIKEKRKASNLEKYGVEHNFCKNHPSRIKGEKRLLEEEGIVNVFQREAVKKKSIETLLSKYGVEHIAQCDDFKVTHEYCIKKYGKEKGDLEGKRICYERGKSSRFSGYLEKYGDRAQEMGEKRFKTNNYFCNTSISSLNKKIETYLKENNIKFESEYCIGLDEFTPRFYDFKINNILIEANGDFGHANPKFYKESDILKLPGNCITAKEIGDKDSIKKKLAEENGFVVVYYGECDLNNNDKGNQIKIELLNYANS